MVVVRFQKFIIMFFIVCGVWLQVNFRLVVEISILLKVSSVYGSICQKMDMMLLLFIIIWMLLIIIQVRLLKVILVVMWCSVVGLKLKWCSIGYSIRLLNGIRIIISSGFKVCICEVVNYDGMVICWFCSIQVDVFWLNSEKNGVVSVKIISMCSIECMFFMVLVGCIVWVWLSWIQVLFFMLVSISISVMYRQIMMFRLFISFIDVIVSMVFRMVRVWFGWFLFGICVDSVVCIMLLNECGFFGGSGISMQCLWFIQNMKVVMNIRMFGMLNVYCGLRFFSVSGISSEVNSELKLMIQQNVLKISLVRCLLFWLNWLFMNEVISGLMLLVFSVIRFRLMKKFLWLFLNIVRQVWLVQQIRLNYRMVWYLLKNLLVS